MQIENKRITLQEIFGSYLTLTHFYEHYQKQRFLMKLFYFAKAVPKLELCYGNTFRSQKIEKISRNRFERGAAEVCLLDSKK